MVVNITYSHFRDAEAERLSNLPQAIKLTWIGDWNLHLIPKV